MSLPLLRVRNQFIYACSCFFFFSSRRRHTRCSRDWSSDVCSSDLTISVADIFYCVPARRKFLKSDTTELGHITSLVTHYALANPAKQFLLTTPTQEIINCPPAEKLADRIYQLFGRQSLEELVEIPAAS